MAISDDLRAVAKFGTPMVKGKTREDLLNAAADEIDRLRSALTLAIGLGLELGITEMEVDAIKARASGESEER